MIQSSVGITKAVGRTEIMSTSASAVMFCIFERSVRDKTWVLESGN